MPQSVIHTSALKVAYGQRIALESLDISVGPGITALLGPNGAGKTTLLSVLTGMRPAGGTVSVGGFSLANRHQRRSASSMVGYLPQRFDLSASMKVLATVRYAAWCNGLEAKHCLSAASHALEVTELRAKANDRVRTLSGGERQRLGLACAIVHRPKVLLLDEPTVGLDPDQRVRFRGYLTSLADDSCVLLATHLLDDVRMLGGGLLILSSGRLVFEGSPEELQTLGRAGDDDLANSMEAGYREVLERALRDSE